MTNVKTRPFILAGEKVNSGNQLTVVIPGTETEYAQVSTAREEHVAAAVSEAATAFEITRKLSTGKRIEILREAIRIIEKEKEQLAVDLSSEAGKPITLARGEVGRAILTFTTAAEEASRIGGEILNLDVTPDAEGVTGFLRRFPIGPVAAITPFNFPVNLVAHKMAPAVAAGCPIVVKPASATPLGALNLANILIRAGWPKKAISVLPCSANLATPLVEDDRFKLITFTGSAEVGWGIKARAGKKRVALELGGNAAAVIDESADLSYAAKRCSVGGFAYAGQSCISVQRIFVHWNKKQDFLRYFIDETQRLKMGAISDPDVLVGPMINESEAKRVESWIKEAGGAGAHILCGGKRKGSFIEPTVITRASADLKVNCQEVFGPVVVVDTFSSWQEVIDKVNDSDFGLQAGVFTQDIDKAFTAFEQIEVGGLVVNDMPTYRVDPQPYGGAKDSGTGREGPKYAIEEMTEIKVMLLRQKNN